MEIDQFEIEPDKTVDKGQSAKPWHAEIAAATKREKEWHDKGSKVVDRYEDERDTKADSNTRMNVLWSNTEVLKSALYSATPVPDVRRRHKDAKANNPKYRAISDILERALIYSVDAYDFDSEIDPAVEDLLLPGRGTVWVDYKADVDETDQITDQRVCASYVYWKDYRQGMARTWAKVPWVARAHYMSKRDVQGRWPEHADRVELTHSVDGVEEDKKDTESEAHKRVKVWEIWDRTSKARLFIATGYDKILESEPDPLGLSGFFPCPQPLYSIKTTAKQVPIPEFVQYQDQANELDTVSARIYKLVGFLKWNGIYDASMDNSEILADIARQEDGQFLPHENFQQIRDKGGIEAAIGFVPIERISGIVVQLLQHRDSVLQTIYEVTGISDIIRGATDPRETKGAQQLKAQFGSMRMQKRQRSVQTFVRDLFRIKAEIISEHFTLETLKLLSGEEYPTNEQKQQAEMQAKVLQADNPEQQLPPQLEKVLKAPFTWDDLLEIMRSDRLRSYHIDVETDSTVLQDAAAEKQGRTEFMTATSELLGQAYQAAESAPQMMPVIKELTLFGMRSHKAGRSMEQAIEDAFDNLTKSLNDKKPEEEQGDDPTKMLEIKRKAAKDQHDAEIDKARLNLDERRLGFEMTKQGEATAPDKTPLELKKHDDEMALAYHKMEQEREIAILNVRAKSTNDQDQNVLKAIETMSRIAEAQNRPKKVVRDEQGRVSGVE